MNSEYMRIKEILILNNVLPQTQKWLREVGKMRNEAFVLWAGSFQSSEIFIVTSAIFPEQRTFRTSTGVGVHVSGEELFNVSRWLYESKQVLIAQIHTHPTQAYHSDTDDNFPLVTTKGQFSIVVPFFAREPLHNLSDCAVYRLNNQNRWNPLLGEARNIFKVVM